jgi:hypothetical protein
MTIITKGMGAIAKKAFSSNAARKKAGYTEKAKRTYTDSKTGKTRSDTVLVKGPVTGFNYNPRMPKAGKKGQGKLFIETRKPPPVEKTKGPVQLKLPLNRKGRFGPRGMLKNLQSKIKKAEIK